MRLRSLAIATTTLTTGLGAQTPPRPAPIEVQHWAFLAGYGPIPMSGAGANLLASRAEGGSFAVRRRLGEGRWWIGFDADAWHAKPTAAGMDSLAARSGIPGVYTGAGGVFNAYGFAVSAQYDAWRSDRLVGYILASAGTNRSGGYINGQCTHFLAPCEHPYVVVSAPGNNPAAMAGLGVRLRLFDRGGWWRAIPQRLYTEARIANQGTSDGRIMMTPMQLGFSW